MKHCFTFLSIFTLATATAQIHEVKSGQYRCVYNTTDGRIDGHYVSYYTNGKKRAEGDFKNHHRYGTWTVWDSLGYKKVERNYSSGLNFTQPAADTSAKKQNNLDGVYTQHRKPVEYRTPREEDITWSKRIWRFIPNKKSNEPLFRKNGLNQNMFTAANKGALTVYSGNNDQFAVPFEGWTADTSATVIGYRIKEDWYFDKVRSVMDVQIVALAPVIQKQDAKDSVNLCWIYFPDLRPLLSKTKIVRCYLATNMDELFAKRGFTSTIYKESNVYDRSLADYLPLKARNAEAERIEMDMIENEHDLWMGIR